MVAHAGLPRRQRAAYVLVMLACWLLQLKKFPRELYHACIEAIVVAVSLGEASLPVSEMDMKFHSLQQLVERSA